MNPLYKKLGIFFSKSEKKKEVGSTSTVKDLKDYKARLYSALSKDLSDFEKNFLLISAGILAFSITFIKDIVKLDTAVHINILFFSWALIALSIGVMMFTFLKSAYSSDELWFIIDDFQTQKNLLVDTDEIRPQDFLSIKEQTNTIFKKSKSNLKWMRFAAVFFFLFGLCFFGLFIGINTYVENKKAASTDTKVQIIIDTETKKIRINDVRISVEDTIIVIEK